MSLGSWGAGVFGIANRALLVIGLHQFLNVPMWFQFGSYTKPDGTVVHGDINMFLAGDPNAGQFTSGFFPIMMFALPAACLAMTHCAKPAAPQGNRRPDDVGRPDVVRHGHHGTDRVLLRVHRARRCTRCTRFSRVPRWR